jgi:hypothetical protein
MYGIVTIIHFFEKDEFWFYWGRTIFPCVHARVLQDDKWDTWSNRSGSLLQVSYSVDIFEDLRFCPPLHTLSIYILLVKATQTFRPVLQSPCSGLMRLKWKWGFIYAPKNIIFAVAAQSWKPNGQTPHSVNPEQGFELDKNQWPALPPAHWIAPCSSLPTFLPVGKQAYRTTSSSCLVHPEDCDCNVRRNGGEATKYETVKRRKRK